MRFVPDLSARKIHGDPGELLAPSLHSKLFEGYIAVPPSLASVEEIVLANRAHEEGLSLNMQRKRPESRVRIVDSSGLSARARAVGRQWQSRN